jgi:hypothetical protein
MGEERKVCKVLVGKPEGKRPLGRPRRRWEDGVRMELREIGFGVWIGFDWLRIGGPVAGCCECGDEPSGSYATELVNVYNTFRPSLGTLNKLLLRACSLIYNYIKYYVIIEYT